MATSGSRDRRPAKKFEYKQRSSEDVKKRSEGGSSSFDVYVQEAIKLFTPKEGDNLIRILPPTWPDAKHYGLDIYLHYQVGADNSAYLCLDKMKGESCPICEARAALQATGDTEAADELKPARRVLVWMINRNEEKDGPIIWSMPWTIDRDLCKLSTNERTGEYLAIDDPEEGFDVEFERKGKAQRTEYIGLRIARRASELGDDDWMEMAVDKPLPDVLNYYDYDHIKKAFTGGKSAHRPTKDEKAGPSAKKDRIDSLTYEKVQAMTSDELFDLWGELDMKGDADQFETDEELIEALCEELELKPAKRSRREVKDDKPSDTDEVKEGMNRLRRGRSE